MAQETNGKRIQCIAVILDEIQADAPNCHQWLVKNNITNVIVDNEISKSFESIKINLGIDSANVVFHSLKGTSIISTWNAENETAITNRIVGHKNEGMSEKYLRSLSLEKVSKAVQKVTHSKTVDKKAASAIESC